MRATSAGQASGARLDGSGAAWHSAQRLTNRARPASRRSAVRAGSCACARVSWTPIASAAALATFAYDKRASTAPSARQTRNTTIGAGRVTARANGRGAKYQEDVLRGVKRFHNLIAMFYEGAFVTQMKKTLTLKNAREGFTSAVAGDMWNEENFLFQKNVL